MNHVDGGGDWCERVAHAIGDGRFLEDPALWRPHVETCDVCRASVTGLFALREHIRKAELEAPVAIASPPGEGPRIIETAFRRYRRGRAIRNAAICVVVGLATTIGVSLAWRSESPKAEEPAAYARRLFRTVFGTASKPDYGLLKRDAELRAEYVRALDHPSSYVRRTAMLALLQSGVTIDAARLTRVLSDWHEDLDFPVVLASASDDTRAVSEALAKQRTATVKATLVGLRVPTAPGVKRVSSDVISRFLADREAEIRKNALMALLSDPEYAPGVDVEDRFRLDPDIEVRRFAAKLLMDRRGEAGAALVVDGLRLRPDDRLETMLVPGLQKYAVGVALANERVAAAATDPALALAHARTVLRSGSTAPPEALIERALQAPTPAIFDALTMLIPEGDWPVYRDRLQALWKSLSKAERSYGGALLVQWDVRPPRNEARLLLALEICEADRRVQERAAAAKLTQDESPAIRERAQKLLDAWPK